MGPVQQWLLGVLSGLWIHVGFILSVGLDAVPLWPLGICWRPGLVLGAWRLEQME